MSCGRPARIEVFGAGLSEILLNTASHSLRAVRANKTLCPYSVILYTTKVYDKLNYKNNLQSHAKR